jgi:hypothetical protein
MTGSGLDSPLEGEWEVKTNKSVGWVGGSLGVKSSGN